MLSKSFISFAILSALGCAPLAASSDSNAALARNILDYSGKFKTLMCKGNPAKQFDTSGLADLERALEKKDFIAAICQKIGTPCEKGAFSLPNELTGFKNCITAVNEKNQPPALYDICCETAAQVSFYMNNYPNPGR